MGRHESPAQIIFGRPLRDGLPTPSHTRPQWGRLRDLRELGHSRLHAKVTGRCLEPLDVGDAVLVQNQHGPKPTRWERTGLVVETLGNRQYSIKMDGSGRITLRNRRFLKKIQPLNPARKCATSTRGTDLVARPHTSEPPGRHMEPHATTVQHMEPRIRPTQETSSDASRELPSFEHSSSPMVSHRLSPAVEVRDLPVQRQHLAPGQVLNSVIPSPNQRAPRRSSRATVPTRRLSMTARGQHYTETVTSVATLRF